MQPLEYYLATERNEILRHARAQMSLKNMQSGRSQTRKATCCRTPFVWHIPTKQIYRHRKRLSGCQGLEGEKNEERLLMGMGTLSAGIREFWN